MRYVLLAAGLLGCTTPQHSGPKPCSSYSTEELQLECERIRSQPSAESSDGRHQADNSLGRAILGKPKQTCVSTKQYDGSVKTTCD